MKLNLFKSSGPRLGSLKHRRVLITGAAAGIGLEIGRQFLTAGAVVGFYDRDQTALTRLEQQLTADFASADWHTGLLDVTDPDQWQSALSQFNQQAGGLDLLVNNAGILYSGDLTEQPLTSLFRMLDVNVKGVLAGCYLALPYLQQSPCARVINLSSASAIIGQPELAVYSASKFAVRGLTEALDAEWTGLGIRVMDLMPLFVATAMTVSLHTASIRRLGRNLTPADVAQVACQAATATSPLAPTHWPVGGLSRLGYHASVGPDFLKRWVNRYISS